jgi:predicted nucleotidyltransferase component of viral defense system
MTERICELLPLIRHHTLFEIHDFRLVGGTALAYHLDHRLSEDLDFCLTGALPLDAIESFIEECVMQFGMDQVEYIEPTQAMIDDFLIGGDRVENYLQTWIVKGVKLQFFDGSANLGTRDFFRDDHFTMQGSIKIASLDTIFKMKSLMFYKRTKARDLYDMLSFYALGDTRFAPARTKALIQHYDRLYRDEASFNALWLSSFKRRSYIAHRDEGLTGLIRSPRSFLAMREELAALFEALRAK